MYFILSYETMGNRQCNYKVSADGERFTSRDCTEHPIIDGSMCLLFDGMCFENGQKFVTAKVPIRVYSRGVIGSNTLRDFECIIPPGTGIRRDMDEDRAKDIFVVKQTECQREELSFLMFHGYGYRPNSLTSVGKDWYDMEEWKRESHPIWHRNPGMVFNYESYCSTNYHKRPE